MKFKLESLLFMIGGVVYIFYCAFFQLTSMDLSKYNFIDSIASDSKLIAWWHVIGFPFFIGIIYLVVAVVFKWCYLKKISAIFLCSICLISGCFMLAINGLASIAIIISTICLIHVGINPGGFKSDVVDY